MACGHPLGPRVVTPARHDRPSPTTRPLLNNLDPYTVQILNGVGAGGSNRAGQSKWLKTIRSTSYRSMCLQATSTSRRPDRSVLELSRNSTTEYRSFSQSSSPRPEARYFAS
jgi:hypothetical protein